MPELPEVQTIATQLAGAITGRTIRRVMILRPDYVRAGRSALQRNAERRTIAKVTRHGKRLTLELDPSAAIVCHLGMSGRITVESTEAPLEPHTHLRITLAGVNREVRFRDPRRFGGIWFLEPDEVDSHLFEKRRGMKIAAARGVAPSRAPHAPRAGSSSLSPLGPDALTVTSRDLRVLLRRRRQVKALLMDQRAVSGLGNIYCDEALFRAGIHPRAVASKLPETRVRRLARSIRAVLREAIRAGGSSLRDYRDASGAPGWFQVNHRVYGREGRPCRRCGRKIVRFTAAGRSTHVCPNCQKCDAV